MLTFSHLQIGIHFKYSGTVDNDGTPLTITTPCKRKTSPGTDGSPLANNKRATPTKAADGKGKGKEDEEATKDDEEKKCADWGLEEDN
jgi:hypothetical protein